MADTIVNMVSGSGNAGGTKRVNNIKTLYEQGRVRASKFRDRQARNYRYVIGDQITEAVSKQLREDNRPEIIFNLTHNIILTVAGHIAGSMSKMRAKPVRMGDEELAGVHTVVTGDYGIGDEGYYEIGKAGIDAAIGGIGWVCCNWDTKDNIMGKPRISAYDPFMVLFDMDARRIDQSDWRWMLLSGWYSADEIIQMLPGMDKAKKDKLKAKAAELEGVHREPGEIKPVSWAEKTMGGLSDIWSKGKEESTFASTNTQSMNVVGTSLDWMDTRAGLYRAVELHDARNVQALWVYDTVSDGREMVPGGLEYDEAFISNTMKKYQRPTLRWIETTQLWKTYVCPSLLEDEELIEEPYEVQGRGFKIKPVICYDWHPDLMQTQSVMDVMISPNDSYNQRQMSMLEWILRATNPDIMLPEGGILAENLEDWKSKKRGKILFYDPQAAPGGFKPEERKPDAAAAQLLSKMGTEHAGMIGQLTGVSPNLQGFAENTTEAASYYTEKVKSALVNLAYLNKHITIASKGVFKYTDGLMQKYMTQQRYVRLLYEPKGIPGVIESGSEEDKLWWLQVNWPTIEGMMNDYSQGEYDWVPDVSQMGASEKQVKYMEGLKLLELLDPQERGLVLPFIVELWDNPMSQKIAGLLRENKGMQDQAAAAQQQQQQAAAMLAMEQKGEEVKQKQLQTMNMPMQMARERMNASP